MTSRRPLLKNRRIWRTHQPIASGASVKPPNWQGCSSSRATAQWTEAEIRYANAPHNAAAAEAARLVLDLCDHCPVIGECAQWAHVDRYTGLAAGSSCRRGQEYDPSNAIHNPRPKDTALAGRGRSSTG